MNVHRHAKEAIASAGTPPQLQHGPRAKDAVWRTGFSELALKPVKDAAGVLPVIRGRPKCVR